MDQRTIEVIEEISRKAARRVRGCSEGQINRASQGLDDVRQEAFLRGVQAWRRAPERLSAEERVRWVARAIHNEVTTQLRGLYRMPETLPYPCGDPDPQGGFQDRGFPERMELREVLGKLAEVATEEELELLLRVAAVGSAWHGYYPPGKSGPRRWAAQQVASVRARVRERLERIGVPIFP